MNKLILIASTILLLGSCCRPNQKRLPTKTEYLRIGFDNGKESYLQIQGTGIYELKYDDELNMQVVEHPGEACNMDGYEMIANDVNFFSVVSEHEYNIKHLGVAPTPLTNTTPTEY
jgi:hypothetical protein